MAHPEAEGTPGEPKVPARPKVLVDPNFRTMGEVFAPEDLTRLNSFAEVVWGRDEPIPPAELDPVKADLTAVVAADWRYGDVSDFPKLRTILEVSGRFPDIDKLDYAACFARGIRVLSCAPSFGPIVAEMALALALSGARGVASGDAAIRAGTERWYGTGSAGTFSLFDQPFGFIGFGSIARSLKPLLAPFRGPIRVYDPYLTDAYLHTHGVMPCRLDELLATSRVIFVLAAPSEANRAMLDRARLERIGQNTLLVLISRAHVVDFDALTELLYERRFRAAIDVFPQEPLPQDHPIRQAPNTVLSAHRAGGDATGYRFIGAMVVNDLEALCAGQQPQQMQVALPELIRNRGTCRK